MKKNWDMAGVLEIEINTSLVLHGLIKKFLNLRKHKSNQKSK